MDTSIHLCLPELLARQAVEAGWAEPHPYAEHPTELMVYAPRDDAELAIVLLLVRASIDHAMGVESGCEIA